MKKTSCFIFPFILLVISLLPNNVRANDSLYYMYQRTMYLENIMTPGSWWANPGIIGETTEPLASTANVTPLAYRYTIVSARYLFPFAKIFGAGLGIMATGISPNSQSTQLDGSGATYTSHYSFANPSFQCGLGMRLDKIASLGILTDIGQELLPEGDGTDYNYLITRAGIGVLTPYYFNILSLSYTMMGTWHFWNQVYMDANAKAGIRFKIMDEFITGSLEYAFSLNSGAEDAFQSSNTYQVVKGGISIRFYKIGGLLLGYSTDFGNLEGGHYDLGPTIHAGLELRKSSDNPFFGGYEIGISTYQRDLIVHRFWLGCSFLPLNQQAKEADN